MGNKLAQVVHFLQHDESEMAQKLFQNIEPENTVDYWLTKGLLEQKFQRWGEAMNAYSNVLELEHKNIEAQNNLHHIQNILNFWNPSMFNP